MRLKTKIKPRAGDTRKIVTWCLLPRHINGETFWLEKITILQKYDYFQDFGGGGLEWKDTKLMDSFSSVSGLVWPIFRNYKNATPKIAKLSNIQIKKIGDRNRKTIRLMNRLKDKKQKSQ